MTEKVAVTVHDSALLCDGKRKIFEPKYLFHDLCNRKAEIFLKHFYFIESIVRNFEMKHLSFIS